jgi:4-hydroxy-tetrahydrodipicolinate synthase
MHIGCAFPLSFHEKWRIHIMKKPVFTGVATALITPFKDGEIDYDAYTKIVEDQIAKGVDALVVSATTGEVATITDDEQLSLIGYTVRMVNKRVPVIAYTGSNCTDNSITMTKEACMLGADAVLVITPYYNKTTKKGLVTHFTAIANVSKVPVIVYNVPSRTGLNLTPDVYELLAKHPMINGVKEANGNLEAMEEAKRLVGDELNFYSGNDDQIYEMTKRGGIGVISVLSNLLPYETGRIVKSYLEGKKDESLALQEKYNPLIKALFSEVNPIPVKEAMAMLGYCDLEYRLPLVPMEDDTKARLIEEMKKVGLTF